MIAVTWGDEQQTRYLGFYEAGRLIADSPDDLPDLISRLVSVLAFLASHAGITRCCICSSASCSVSFALGLPVKCSTFTDLLLQSFVLLEKLFEFRIETWEANP